MGLFYFLCSFFSLVHLCDDGQKDNFISLIPCFDSAFCLVHTASCNCLFNSFSHQEWIVDMGWQMQLIFHGHSDRIVDGWSVLFDISSRAG